VRACVRVCARLGRAMWRQPRLAAAASRGALRLRPPLLLGPAPVCGFALEARRGVIGPAGPTQVLVDAAGYPEHSMARQLLQRCMDEALLRGVDVTAEYKPWIPVDIMQTLIVNVHDYAGCSWFMSIVVACLGIRVLTLPVSVAAIRGAREKALIQPEFIKLTDRQKSLSLEGDQTKVQEISKQLQAFTQKHGKFFMLKGTWNLLCFQMPLYITAFAAMRGFASHPDVFRGFAMEAPLWLDSLALADPTAILPLFTAAIMMTNTEIFGSIDTEVSQATPLGEAATSGAQQGTMQKYQKWIMRGSALMFIPMTWNFPAGVFVFMSTNLMASSVQNRILKLPVLERLLELPPTADKQAMFNAAASMGPSALVPLGSTLRHVAFGGKLGTVAARSPPVRSGQGAGRPELEVERRRQENALRASMILSSSSSSSSVKPAATEAVKSSLELLEVSRRFAVRKARPVQAA